jgi:drug/metabolite transporter (DMT)-like permease
MGRRLTVAEHHRRWMIWTAVVVFLAAAAVVVIALARDGRIDAHPWGYIALIVAVLCAVAASIFVFAMAAIEDRGD